MKKNLFVCTIIAAFAMIAMSFTTKNEESINEQAAPKTTTLTIKTGANGEIISVKDAEGCDSWRIKDISGVTNIRNKPNGKVCMKLKAWTEYSIETTAKSGNWLRVVYIYNWTENYEVRLHGSKTGYWIARSILYRDNA